MVEQRRAPGLIRVTDFAAGLSAVARELASVDILVAIPTLRASVAEYNLARAGNFAGSRKQPRFVTTLAGGCPVRSFQREPRPRMIKRSDAVPGTLSMAYGAARVQPQLVRITMTRPAFETSKLKARLPRLGRPRSMAGIAGHRGVRAD